MMKLATIQQAQLVPSRSAVWRSRRLSTLKYMTAGHAPTRDDAREMVKALSQAFGFKFDKKVRSAIGKQKLATRDQRFFEQLMSSRNVGGRLTLLNNWVRTAAQTALVETTLVTFQTQAINFRLGTLLCDMGVSYEDRPRLDLSRLRDVAVKAFASQNIEAFCVFEMDALSRPLVGEHARRIMLHVHAICWTRGGEFAPGKAIEAMVAAVPELRSANGARPVTLTWREKDWLSVANLAGYVLKTPKSIKKAVPRAGEMRLLNAPDREYSHALALRMAEFHSKVGLEDLVFSVGSQGQLFEKRWHEALVRKLASRRGTYFEASEARIESIWQKIFGTHAGQYFMP